MKKVIFAIALLALASSAFASGLVVDTQYWLEWTTYNPNTPTVSITSGLGSISTQPGVFSINIFELSGVNKGNFITSQKAFCVDLGHYISNPWTATYRMGLSSTTDGSAGLPSGMNANATVGLDTAAKKTAAWNRVAWIAAQNAGNGTTLQMQGAQLAIWDQMRGDIGAASWDTTGDLKIANLAPTLNGLADPYIAGAATAVANGWTGNNSYWWEAAPPVEAGTASQDIITSVPEPGTILAALSILAPAGMIFRRRKVIS